LVNRAVSFAARNIGSIPEAGALTGLGSGLLARSRQAFDTVGEHLGRSRFKFAITEAMRTVAEANKYFSEQAPWKLRESDPERMRTGLHVALQLVDDAKTLLTPFLPRPRRCSPSSTPRGWTRNLPGWSPDARHPFPERALVTAPAQPAPLPRPA